MKTLLCSSILKVIWGALHTTPSFTPVVAVGVIPNHHVQPNSCIASCGTLQNGGWSWPLSALALYHAAWTSEQFNLSLLPAQVYIAQQLNTADGGNPPGQKHSNGWPLVCSYMVVLVNWIMPLSQCLYCHHYAKHSWAGCNWSLRVHLHITLLPLLYFYRLLQLSYPFCAILYWAVGLNCNFTGQLWLLKVAVSWRRCHLEDAYFRIRESSVRALEVYDWKFIPCHIAANCVCSPSQVTGTDPF